MKISATEAQVLLLPTQIRDEALKRFHVSLVLDYHHHLVTRQNDYGLPDSVRCKVDTIMFCMKGCWDEDDLLKPDRSSNLQHFVVFGTLSKFFSYANWKDKHLHAPASEQDEARWKAMLAETWLGLCDKGLIRSGAVRYRRELLKHGVIRPLLQYDDGLVKIYISMKAVETDSNSNPIASMIGLGNAESLPDMWFTWENGCSDTLIDRQWLSQNGETILKEDAWLLYRMLPRPSLKRVRLSKI